MSRARRAIAVLLAAGCVEPPDDVSVRAGLRRVEACAVAGEFPVRVAGARGAVGCARLGATEAPSRVDPGMLRVELGAPAGGDGSALRPFASIAEALGTRPDARALALSRGLHRVRGLALAHDLALYGVASGATSITAASGEPILRAQGARIELVSLTVQGEAGGGAASALLALDGGELRLRDVRLRGGLDAVHGVNAAVRGERVTFESPARAGVLAEGGAVRLEDFVVRDAGTQGLRFVGAHFDLRRGVVTGCGRHGIVATGAVPPGGGRRSCVDGTDEGALDCLREVSALANRVAGIYLEGARRVEARTVLAAGTLFGEVAGGRAGDGLVVSGAELRVDPELSGEAARGVGSFAVDNDRVGLLVQGAGSSVEVRGALFAANRGGGMVIGAGGELGAVRDSLFEDNAVGGLLATPGTRVGVVQCNGIVDSRPGQLETSVGTISLGDGLHLNGVQDPVSLVDNEVSSSARFGVLLYGATAAARGNRGAGNRYGFGLYAGATLRGSLGSILGALGAPTLPPMVLNGL